MRTRSILTVFVIIFLAAAALLAAEPVRAGRVAGLGHFALGTSSGDAAAEAGVAAEYGLLENLGVGGGWTYVDGYYLQLHCIEAYAKAYLFGKPLDAFAAAAVQLSVSPGFDVLATLRAGGEWQSPWKFFAGVQAAALFQFPGVGWLGGVYVGARF
jgi:hypothetical protein